MLRCLDDSLPQDLPPTTGLLVAPAGGGEWTAAGSAALVLAMRPAGVEAQPVLLCAALREAEAADSGPELWLSRTFLRHLGLAPGRKVRVWPVRRPPLLGWLLLGGATQAGRGQRSGSASAVGTPVLVRRGETLPGSALLVLEARPAMQGLLGAATRLAVTELRGGNGGESLCLSRREPLPPPPLVCGWARCGERLVKAQRGHPALCRGGERAGGEAETHLWLSRDCLHGLGLFQGEWVAVTRQGEAEAEAGSGCRAHLAVVRALNPPWAFPPRDENHGRAAPAPDINAPVNQRGALCTASLAFNLSCDPLEGSLLKIQVMQDGEHPFAAEKDRPELFCGGEQ